MSSQVATYTLRKAERLCGKAANTLFVGGKGGFCHPYRYVLKVREATAEDKAAVSVLFAVPKRNIRHAVDRNLLKRRTREAYRLSKHPLVAQATERGVHIDMALIYSTKVVSDYKTVKNGVENVLAKVARGL